MACQHTHISKFNHDHDSTFGTRCCQCEVWANRPTPSVSKLVCLLGYRLETFARTIHSLASLIQDVALIRCTVVDAAGVPVHSSSINVTFSIASGPGFVWASHNGDPACQVCECNVFVYFRVTMATLRARVCECMCLCIYVTVVLFFCFFS